MSKRSDTRESTRNASRGKRPQGSTSREEILAALTAAGVPLSLPELARRLGATDDAAHHIDTQIAELEHAGFVMRNRRGELCIASKLDLVSGTIQGHPDGFGFVVPDNGGDDLFIAPREMRKVLHGDRVNVKRIGYDRRGRPEGEIVDVLVRANHEVVGRLHEERGIWFVEAENRRINQDLLIPPHDVNGASAGQVVVAEILEQPSEHREPIARIKHVLGSATDPGIEIEIALRKHDLPFEFSAAARRQADRLPPEVRAADRKSRIDLTALPLVTIDGETAKDFDDAVYCERNGSGFRLVVAIADVSHYVRDGDALDIDARERGTSVYFPRRVIPMLPEALSNELCSLKPRVDRLALVCDMQISGTGTIERYEFHPAIIHSHARLTYTQVWRWLSQPESAKSSEAKALLPHLRNLHALFRVLLATREARGAIDFDTDELALEFDEHGKIVRIVPSPRNDAHRLIEESMLAANVCAAEFLAQQRQPGLYRVHEGPPPDKLTALREFLAGSALSLGGGNKPTAGDYARLLEQVRTRPDYALLQTVLLRSLSQAQYRPANVGHFGLAYEAYMHFTSPIRRYPDLLTHRAIKAVLAGKHYTPSSSSWDALGLHCSMTERRADDASRDVLQWLKCHYMKDRIGEEFEGTITGVASFGIFVTLDGLNIDGLVHVTELPRDYFHFDAPRHALIGERSGRVFQLAGRVRVQVARVDLETAKIDFTLAEGNIDAHARTPPSSKSQPRSRAKRAR
ncbi:MAG TPA: ribonuclease R [Casimicrobiaceae bacterium]